MGRDRAGPSAPSPCSAFRPLFQGTSQSLSFIPPHPLTFSFTSPLLFFSRKSKASSSLSKSRTCRHLWEGGKRKSQRSFKISAFEYSKLRNARHVDRPCGRLHSDLPAHYLLSEKKKKSSRQGAEQICTDLPFDAPTGSFPPPTAVPPAVLCSSQTAPGCPGPGVAGGERIGWDEDQEEDQVDGL